MLVLPLKSPRFDQLSDIAWKQIETREAGITGVLDTTRGRVTLRGNRSLQVTVTGLAGGTLYGGQRQYEAYVSRYFPRTYNIDRALDR